MRGYPTEMFEDQGYSMGVGEVAYQDKSRPHGGMLLLMESRQKPGAGVLQCRGHYGEATRESLQVAFSCVRSHVGELRRALSGAGKGRGRDLLARDMDTVVHCLPANVIKGGSSRECYRLTEPPIQLDVLLD